MKDVILALGFFEYHKESLLSFIENKHFCDKIVYALQLFVLLSCNVSDNAISLRHKKTLNTTRCGMK